MGASGGTEPTVFSGLFVFVFVHEEAKAIDIGSAESPGPTAWGSGTPGLPSRWILLPGISRNQYKLKKAWASKVVSLPPTQNQPECDLQHSPSQPEGLYLLAWEPFGQIWKGDQGLKHSRRCVTSKAQAWAYNLSPG